MDNIFPNAENVTFYISTSRYSKYELQAGSIPDQVLLVTLSLNELSNLTYEELFRHRFSGLKNGTYWVSMAYSNPLGNGFSNVLEFKVAIDPEPNSKQNNEIDNPFSEIDGYPNLIFVITLGISLLWVKYHKKKV